MPADKLSLLFGREQVPDDVDLDNEDELHEYLQETTPFPLDELEVAFRIILTRQILGEDPPLVWETARRLRELGLDRHEVLQQLSRALAPIVESAIHGDDEDFNERYETNLRSLPLTSDEDLRRAVRALVPPAGVAAEELTRQVLAELGVSEVTDAAREPVDRVLDEMQDDGEIDLLAGDLVVAPAALCAGIVLTTRLPHAGSWPPVNTDFAGLAVLTDDFGVAPSAAAAGQLIKARVSDAVLAIEVIEEPPDHEGLVASVRQAYDTEHAEAGQPISFRELTLRMLVEDPSAFENPRLPLTELVAAAGLEIRADLIAGDEATWRNLAHLRASFRIVELLADDDERCHDAGTVYDLFERIDLGDGDAPVTASDLRHALDLMADDDVFPVVVDQFFGYEEDPKSLDATEVFARRLTLAASKPMQRAVAGVLTAMVEERRRNPLAAADALAGAVREAPDFFPAVDRLAWTRADQGRASEAKALWLRLGMPEHPDVQAIDAATAGLQERGAGLRRNEPCWCGSGRKFKNCHLHANELPSLTDRFTWMLRKTIGYVERRGAPLDNVIFGIAWRLADDDPERFREAMASPIVLDLVVFEFGWLETFLAERGVLLPEDERELFASWLAIPRALYEITALRPGESVTVRDVRTGKPTEVTEHTYSRVAAVGQLICSRVVPDGQSHQLVGALIEVDADRRQLFLDILGAPDSAAVAEGLLDHLATQPAFPRP